MARPDAISEHAADAERSWLADASRPDIVRRSLRVAALVGSILVAINHFGRWLAGMHTRADHLEMAITYLVPYAVATYAAVDAIRKPGAGHLT